VAAGPATDNAEGSEVSAADPAAGPRGTTASFAAPADGVLRLVAGMSRAGTTWVGKCLNAHPDAAVFGESLFWGRKYVEPDAEGRYDNARLDAVESVLGSTSKGFLGTGPGCLRCLTWDNRPEVAAAALAPLRGTHPTPRETFAAYAAEIARREGKRIVIEKTPHNVLWIDRIAEAWPDFRMLVLVREPYAFMLSYKHQGDRKDAEVRDEFRALYHPVGCAAVWRGYMKATLELAARHPERTLVVPFADLVRAPAETFGRIQTFFGLAPEPIHERVPADNTSFPDHERPELAPEDRLAMNLVAGRWIERGGFDRQPAPFAPLRTLRAGARLVPWAWRSYRHLVTTMSASPLEYARRWIGGMGR